MLCWAVQVVAVRSPGGKNDTVWWAGASHWLRLAGPGGDPVQAAESGRVLLSISRDQSGAGRFARLSQRLRAETITTTRAIRNSPPRIRTSLRFDENGRGAGLAGMANWAAGDVSVGGLRATAAGGSEDRASGAVSASGATGPARGSCFSGGGGSANAGLGAMLATGGITGVAGGGGMLPASGGKGGAG